MNIELYSYQVDAIKMMENGNILCGGVGTGKSRTSIAYALIKDCDTSCRTIKKWKTPDDIEVQLCQFGKPTKPKDIYIITTAKKRDTGEWEQELREFGLSVFPDLRSKSMSDIHCVVDSWNNIAKFKKVYDAIFIFDEQRVTGSGPWVKAFKDIARKNRWILLSATPGDNWLDYLPVFLANGFYRNKTEFEMMHVIYKPYRDYKDVDHYINEGLLYSYLADILIPMNSPFQIKKTKVPIVSTYDKELYKKTFKFKWDPFDDQPIENISKLCYLLRRICNEDYSKIKALEEILEFHDKAIIFYNYTPELEILRRVCSSMDYEIGEWNGEKHTQVPTSDRWVYLCQYNSASEGWNCITTDTIIFYSLNYSYKMMAQAEGRIERLNTPFKELFYYYMSTKAPIDQAIQQALKEKKNFNEKKFLNHK